MFYIANLRILPIFLILDIADYDYIKVLKLEHSIYLNNMIATFSNHLCLDEIDCLNLLDMTL